MNGPIDQMTDSIFNFFSDNVYSRNDLFVDFSIFRRGEKIEETLRCS